MIKYTPKKEGFRKPLKPIIESNLPSSCFHVMVILWWHVGNNDSTYVGIDRLCQETGLSKPTVIKAIQIAEDNGLIIVERRVNATSIYRLNPDKFKWESPLPADKFNPKGSNAFTPKGLKKLPGKNKDIKPKKKENQELESGASKLAQSLLSDGSIEKAGEKITVQMVWNRWKAIKQEKYPSSKFFSKPTQQVVGQLKYFISEIVPYDPIEIIECLVENWVAFRDWIEIKSFVNATPYEPVIGYILTHRDEAVNFVLNKKAKKVQQLPLPTPKESKEVPVSVKPEVKQPLIIQTENGPIIVEDEYGNVTKEYVLLVLSKELGAQ